MQTVNGCQLPLHLYYDVPNHIWYAPLDNGDVRMGMTPVAVALADNRIFAFTPKRPGRDLEKGRSFATIESGKWVGPARAAFDGLVIEANDDLIDRPGLLVTDPYAAAWMIVARPAAADALAGLVTGQPMHAAYEAWMRDNDFAGCTGGPP